MRTTVTDQETTNLYVYANCGVGNVWCDPKDGAYYVVLSVGSQIERAVYADESNPLIDLVHPYLHDIDIRRATVRAATPDEAKQAPPNMSVYWTNRDGLAYLRSASDGADYEPDFDED